MEAVNVMSTENVCASPSARLARRASICRASSLFQAFSKCRNRPFPNAETSFSRAFQPTTEQRDTPFRHAETPSTDKRDVLPRGGAPEVRQGCRESNTEQPQFSAANRAA